jgi:hypothetical protein
MSLVKANTYQDASGGSNAVFSGVASPPSSMGFRNRILNGNMVIDQRNAGASITANGSTYAVDRFVFSTNQVSKATAQRSTTAPAGFTNSLLVTSSAATSFASGDYFSITQKIEGFNCADLAWGTASAVAVTISFRVRSSLTGTFGGAINNSAGNRSYPFSYTISAANTWEEKTIVVPGDTTGTWLTDNGTGMNVRFALGMGSTYSGTAGAWTAGDIESVTGAVNVLGTNGATFYITGVQLEAGTNASAFEQIDYGRELMMCQRYYYRQTSQAAGDYFVPNAYGISTTQAFGYNTFPVPMRTRPTALEQSGTAADYNVVRCGLGTNANCSSVPTFGVANLTSAQTVFTVSSGLSNGTAGSVQANNTNAYLGWSAEL